MSFLKNFALTTQVIKQNRINDKIFNFITGFVTFFYKINNYNISEYCFTIVIFNNITNIIHLFLKSQWKQPLKCDI